MSSPTVNQTDLTQTEGEPTERANVHIVLEKTTIKAKLLGGNAVELGGESLPGSPQSAAYTTFLLVLAGVLVTGTAATIGVPAMTALIAGLSPFIIFAFIRATSGRQGR